MKANFVLLALVISLWGCLTVRAEDLLINHGQSSITVLVDSTLHDFQGSLTNFDVKIALDPQENLPWSTDVAFDFKDLKTGDTNRDADMLKWMGYPTNAMGAFNLIGWKHDGTNAIAMGEMTLHGMKQTIEAPLVVTHTGADYQINGWAKLDYRDYGLPVIRKMLILKVSPQLTVKFHLVGKLAQEKSEAEK